MGERARPDARKRLHKLNLVKVEAALFSWKPLACQRERRPFPDPPHRRRGRFGASASTSSARRPCWRRTTSCTQARMRSYPSSVAARAKRGKAGVCRREPAVALNRETSFDQEIDAPFGRELTRADRTRIDTIFIGDRATATRMSRSRSSKISGWPFMASSFPACDSCQRM